MAFNDLELQRIKNSVGALCARRSPEEFKDQLRIDYEVDGHAVTIYENRPAWNKPEEWTRLGVARIRYTRTRNEWLLYWMRRDLKWHLYDPAEMSAGLEELVRIVDEDEFGAFWG